MSVGAATELPKRSLETSTPHKHIEYGTLVSDLWDIKGNAKIRYGRGTGAGDIRCAHCGKALGHIMLHKFNKENPDSSIVVGWYEEEHVCRKTGETYTVGFSDTTPFDLMQGVRESGIEISEWLELEKNYYASRNLEESS